MWGVQVASAASSLSVQAASPPAGSPSKTSSPTRSPFCGHSRPQGPGVHQQPARGVEKIVPGAIASKNAWPTMCLVSGVEPGGC